jgi:outer membrane immunogenic protein
VTIASLMQQGDETMRTFDQPGLANCGGQSFVRASRRKIQRILAAGALLTGLLAVPAMAADLAVKAAPPYVAPAWSWTGCYLGVHAGGGIHHSDFTSLPEEGGNIGVVAGGQAGCNYQVRQLVVGIEGELSWANLESKNDQIFPGSNEIHDRAKNTVDAAIALRLGYAFDRLLFFGKLGADWGRFKWTDDQIDFPGTGCECAFQLSAERTLPGLLIGAGFEYAFLDNWTAKLEYDHINFGNPTADFAVTSCSSLVGNPASCARITGFGRTVRDTKQIVKIGINYKFGGGPVVANY